MKFLHIADLHIGRRLSGISLLEDQRHILGEILDIAAECDAVLIAGDVYDKPRPGGEAVKLAGDFLTRLSRLGKPVYLVAGNHDGGELVEYCSAMLADSGIHAVGSFDGKLRRHVLRDEHGEIHLYLLPFVKPLNVRAALGGEGGKIETYADALRAAVATAELDPAARNVLVAHQYVSGAELSDSEQRIVGGLDQVPPEVFDGFDYVALGHLHAPQRLCGGRVCYAGSPLKYALTEERQRKGAAVVTLGAKGEAAFEHRPLAPLRDVRTVTGPLAGIAAPERFSEDFVGAVVTDELPPPDPLGALRIAYPNLIGMRVQNSRTNQELNVTELESAERKDPLEHFIDFYTAQNNQVPPDQRRIDIMRDIIREVREGTGHASD